jgi:hypothetical protein
VKQVVHSSTGAAGWRGRALRCARAARHAWRRTTTGRRGGALGSRRRTPTRPLPAGPHRLDHLSQRQHVLIDGAARPPSRPNRPGTARARRRSCPARPGAGAAGARAPPDAAASATKVHEGRSPRRRNRPRRTLGRDGPAHSRRRAHAPQGQAEDVGQERDSWAVPFVNENGGRRTRDGRPPARTNGARGRSRGSLTSRAGRPACTPTSGEERPLLVPLPMLSHLSAVAIAIETESRA